MDSFVKNPKSGRLIKVGGTLYKSLQKEGIRFDSKRVQKKKFVPVLDKKVGKKVSVNPTFKVDRTDVKWEEKKPHTAKERKMLHERCGDDAFLLPSALKFPICNKITKKEDACTYNCRGLKGASSRAGEWKYKNVLKKSKALTAQLGCYKQKVKKKV